MYYTKGLAQVCEKVLVPMIMSENALHYHRRGQLRLVCKGWKRTIDTLCGREFMIRFMNQYFALPDKFKAKGDKYDSWRKAQAIEWYDILNTWSLTCGNISIERQFPIGFGLTSIVHKFVQCFLSFQQRVLVLIWNMQYNQYGDLNCMVLQHDDPQITLEDFDWVVYDMSELVIYNQNSPCRITSKSDIDSLTNILNE